MIRLSILILAIMPLCSTELVAQNSGSQESTYQVSTAQPWTDTGLDFQVGDRVEISASAAASSSGAPACDPTRVLFARLHAGNVPSVLVGAGAELKIDQPSHLFLGLNGTTCQGSVAVTVRKISSSSSSGFFSKLKSEAQNLNSNSSAPDSQSTQPESSSSSSPSSADGQKTRGEQLKSQLSTAAGVFMSGQFGNGNSPSTPGASNAVSGGASGADNVSSAPTLKVSDETLDSDLRKGIDGLPRRVNDQFQNLGDMVNFVIVGQQKDVQAALDAANWHVADTNNEKAVLSAVMETYQSKDYLQMPMSTLYLFGRKQDFGYEMAEPIAMVASRHHFRIWKAPFTWKDEEVWVGAGTHDIGFAKDKRNGNVTHKIDPAVDGERDNIAGSLQKANKTKRVSYYLPPDPVQDAKNATGDGYHSDGRLVVVFLQ